MRKERWRGHSTTEHGETAGVKSEGSAAGQFRNSRSMPAWAMREVARAWAWASVAGATWASSNRDTLRWATTSGVRASDNVEKAAPQTMSKRKRRLSKCMGTSESRQGRIRGQLWGGAAGTSMHGE